MRPARVTTFRPADVKSIRERIKASQTEFALMIGVSVATLRNWEQRRRTPDGPALTLLRVAARNPRAVAEALHREPRSVVRNRGMSDDSWRSIWCAGLSCLSRSSNHINQKD